MKHALVFERGRCLWWFAEGRAFVTQDYGRVWRKVGYFRTQAFFWLAVWEVFLQLGNRKASVLAEMQAQVEDSRKIQLGEAHGEVVDFFRYKH